MKKAIQILKWGMLLALTVVVLAFTNKKQEEQLVVLNQINVEVSEDEFMTEQIALNYIDQHNFDFDSVVLSSFYLNDLETTLFHHPSVKSVQVYSNQLGLMNIKIVQRKAVVRILTNQTD